MQLTKWTEEDLAAHKQLDGLLSKYAEEWNLSIADGIKLYRSLVWFHGLREKIKESQAEVVKVHPAKEEEKKRVPGKKATREAQAAQAGS